MGGHHPHCQGNGSCGDPGTAPTVSGQEPRPSRLQHGLGVYTPPRVPGPQATRAGRTSGLNSETKQGCSQCSLLASEAR